MEKKSLQIISIGLAVLLLLSIITIAILATLLVGRTQNNEINVEPAIIEQTDKIYSLANVNFATTADGNSTIGQSVNLQASVYPFNATDKELSWSLYWKNAESEWAINKIVSDYVICVVDNENSTKARITELQAFGETIICKVSSVKQPDKFAIIEINHLATIIDFYAKFGYNGQTYEFTKNSTSSGSLSESGVPYLDIKAIKDKYVENFSLIPLYNDVNSKNNADLMIGLTAICLLNGEYTASLGHPKMQAIVGTEATIYILKKEMSYYLTYNIDRGNLESISYEFGYADDARNFADFFTDNNEIKANESLFYSNTLSGYLKNMFYPPENYQLDISKSNYGLTIEFGVNPKNINGGFQQYEFLTRMQFHY